MWSSHETKTYIPKKLVRVKNCCLEIKTEEIKVRSGVGREFVLSWKDSVCFWSVIEESLFCTSKTLSS